MGKTEKKREENHATNVTKIPKTKRWKYGMNKTHTFVNAIDSGLKCKNFGLNPEFFNFYLLDIFEMYKVN